MIEALKTSPVIAKAHAAIRKVSPKIEQDRVFAGDFANLADRIRGGGLVV